MSTKIFSILNFVKKQMMKTDKDGIMKLPGELQSKYGEAVIIKQLMDAGVDPRTIKNEQQLIGVLDSIDAMKAKRTTKPGTTGIMKTKEAEVFDLQGNRLDPDKKITGGTQETEDMIKKKLEEQNKKAVQDFKKKMEDTEDKADGGRIGFKGGADLGTVDSETRKATAKSVDISPTGNVTTSRDKGPDPVDDRSTFEQTVNQRDVFDKPKENPIKNIIEAGADFNYLKNLYQLNPQGIATSFLLNRINNVLFPEEDKADGGRIGFKKGSMDRRTFMKIMGGLATLPFVGRYFKGAEKAAPIAEKAVEAVQAAPNYFFELLAKIKMFGNDIKGSGERITAKKYKDYTLEEDIVTGDVTIKKTKEGVVGDMEGVMQEEYMILKKGNMDETTKGRIPPDEYEELTVKPDMEGKMKDVEGGLDSVEEIINEVSKKSAPIKKAAGGLAYMLGE
tara:strand:+ start:141 stop:1484 length:1344 start_codon:yes stop_codon:yes gene_type:complete